MLSFLTNTAAVNQLQNIAILCGGFLVAKGYLSGDQLTAIVGGAFSLLTVVANVATHSSAQSSTPPAAAK